MLDLHRLRVLREVVRTGSFSAAARELRITPSAVSQQIGALERSLGLPVVHRGPRGVSVTEPGRMLADVTAELDGDLGQVERHLAAYADGLVGRLAIATFPTAGLALLPRALIGLTARTEVELDVRESEPQDTVPLLAAGGADVGLVYHFFTPTPPREWEREYEYTPLLGEEMYAALPARHPLADRAEIELADLADERWVQGVRDCGLQTDQYCLAAGFRPRTACRASDYGFMQTLVAGGVGVGLIPALALAPQIEGLAFVRVRPFPHRYVGVLRRKGRWHPPLGSELVDRLRETAVELAKPGITPLG